MNRKDAGSGPVDSTNGESLSQSVEPCNLGSVQQRRRLLRSGMGGA